MYKDPGETTGWALGCGLKLLAAGQLRMKDDQFEMWKDIHDEEVSTFRDPQWWRPGVDPADYLAMDIRRLVMEDWRLYPDKLKSLAWDPCRTARHIGALTFMAQLHDIPVIMQPAAIKTRAVKGGAQELFDTPLHENRHANDAKMHFFYYTQTELMGLKFSGLDNLPGKATSV